MSDRSLSVIAASVAVMTLVTACSPATVPAPAAKPTTAPSKVETSVAKPTLPPADPTPTLRPAAETPRYGGILNIPQVSDTSHFDIQQEVANAVNHMLQSSYNGITQFDPNKPSEIIGDLAKSWEVGKDGLTYTFHLNEGVKFHDGSLLSSEDVKFSFERMAWPAKGIAAPRAADLAPLSKIEAPDKNTVKFVLKYPSTAILAAASSGWMAIYSKSFVEKKGDMRRDVMGTGPFKFRRHVTGLLLEQGKNPDYFVKGRPYLDGINFYIIRDAATSLAAFRTGQVKLTGLADSGVKPAGAESIKKTLPQAIVVSYPSLCVTNFILNTQEKPWTDVRARKAVDLAIDRQSAVKVLGKVTER